MILPDWFELYFVPFASLCIFLLSGGPEFVPRSGAEYFICFSLLAFIRRECFIWVDKRLCLYPPGISMLFQG
jgi:hypothetical protein